MVQDTSTSAKSSRMLQVGIALGVLCLVGMIAAGIYLAARSGVLNTATTADAVIFFDVEGRIAIDTTLQVHGPAPVPVSAGTHTVAFFDSAIPPANPAITVAQGEFQYVSNMSSTPAFPVSNERGYIAAAAFPPDTTLEIPNCTPVEARQPTTCKSTHRLTAQLSPGTYTLRFTNPNLGTHEEQLVIAAGTAITREHSFITTTNEWNTWRQNHGDILERNYDRYRHRGSAGSALLLPFRAADELVDGLF